MAYYESLPQAESDGLKDLERELVQPRDREEVILELLKRKLMKISEGQQEIEQDIRPRVAINPEKLRMAGRIVRLPSLWEAEASLREIVDGPMPETYQDRRKILDRIGELRMTYLDGELEIAGKVPIRTEPAESTISGGLEVILKEGPPGLRRLACGLAPGSPMSMPSLSNSPWMRGAPHRILAAHLANQFS
jgi:hypothetical protein